MPDIRHLFVSPVADNGRNHLVQGPAWNEPHALLQGPQSLLGRSDSVPGQLPTGEVLLDPATLAFVDGKLSVVGAGTYLPLAGGTLTGPLTGTTATFSAVTTTSSYFFGAATNFNPALIPTGSDLMVRYGDDSAYAGIEAAWLYMQSLGVGITWNNTGGAVGQKRFKMLPHTVNGDLAIAFQNDAGDETARTLLTRAGGATFTGAVTHATPVVGATTTESVTAEWVNNKGYLTTTTAGTTYLPLAGGTLTGALTGTTATFSDASLPSTTTQTVASKLSIGGNFSRAAWTTVGPILNIATATLTDTTTATSGVVSFRIINGIYAPVLNSTNTGVVVTSAVTLYINGGPAGTGNTTVTNKYGLWVNADASRFAAPTTTYASITLPHGTAPTTPANGDMWTTTAGVFIRINGVTKTFTTT